MKAARYLVVALMVATVLPLTVRVGYLTVYTVDVVLGAALALMLLRTLTGRMPRLKPGAVEVGMAAFLLLVWFSSFLSINVPASLDAAAVWTRFLFIYLIYRWLLSGSEVSDRDIVTVSRALLWFLVAIGLIQLATGTQFGLVANYFGEQVQEFEFSTSASRLSGTTYNSNVYGTWLALLIIPLLITILFTKAKSTSASIVVLGAVVLLVVATLSRSALLLLFAVFATAVFLSSGRGGKGKQAAAMIVLSSVALVFAALSSDFGNDLVDRFLGRALDFESRSITSRIEAVDTVLPVLSTLKNLLVGVGPAVFHETAADFGVYNRAYADYVDLTTRRSGIHNVFLNFLTEYGVIGLSLVTYVYLKTLRQARAQFQARKSISTIASLLLLLAILLPAQLNTVIWSINAMPFVVFAMASVHARAAESRRSVGQRAVRSTRSPARREVRGLARR